MKKWLILIAGLLCIASVAYYFFHEKRLAEPTNTVTVKKGDITEQARAVGYIKPLHSITVKSQIDGTVKEAYHDEGEYVTKGEPLLKIKPAPNPSDYASTYQALQTALTKEKIAKQDLDRYKIALKNRLITKNYTDYIDAKQRYETTTLDRQLAAQKLTLIQKGRIKVGGKTIENTVVSPIDGCILARNVDTGDPVISLSSAQSATTLFTVANMHDLMFEGSVDEMDAAKIHTGMPATVVVGSNPDEKITGRLSLISLQSTSKKEDSPFNVGFNIKITDLNIPKDLRLRSGYSATASINLKTVKNVLVIPERVIHFDYDKTYVLLPEKRKNAKPKQHPVTLGLSDGIHIEIISGLKLGDKVLDITAPNGNED